MRVTGSFGTHPRNRTGSQTLDAAICTRGLAGTQGIRLVSCLLSLFCQGRSLGTPTLERNRIRTHWLSCSAPLTRGIPASFLETVHGLRMQDVARMRGHFCSLDVMPDYGTDHRLNDRYTLCDHGWLLYNHRLDNCVKHDDISQLSSSPKQNKSRLLRSLVLRLTRREHIHLSTFCSPGCAA